MMSPAVLEEAAAELHDGGEQFPGVLAGGEDLPEAFDPRFLIDQGQELAGHSPLGAEDLVHGGRG